MKGDPLLGVLLGRRGDVVEREDASEEMVGVVVVELGVELRVLDRWVGLREDTLLWEKKGGRGSGRRARRQRETSRVESERTSKSTSPNLRKPREYEACQ